YDPAGPLRRTMIAAAEAAGFVDVDLLAEPVAAAWSPVRCDRRRPRRPRHCRCRSRWRGSARPQHPLSTFPVGRS
ncbi:hypothetical protein KBI5_13815, partial [Frankia sp. KB5]